MRILNIIQSQPTDSLNHVQTEIIAIAEKLSTTPADELITDLLDKAVAFGLKVLAALLLYL